MNPFFFLFCFFFFTWPSVTWLISCFVQSQAPRPHLEFLDRIVSRHVLRYTRAHPFRPIKCVWPRRAAQSGPLCKIEQVKRRSAPPVVSNFSSGAFPETRACIFADETRRNVERSGEEERGGGGAERVRKKRSGIESARCNTCRATAVFRLESRR